MLTCGQSTSKIMELEPRHILPFHCRQCDNAFWGMRNAFRNKGFDFDNDVLGNVDTHSLRRHRAKHKRIDNSLSPLYLDRPDMTQRVLNH